MTLADAQDSDLPLIFVNQAYQDMTGYDETELIGRNPRFLQGVDRDQRNIDIVRKCIREQASCEVVLRNYRKNGELFWNELKISPILDHTGELKYFVGIQSDVTHRRQLREKVLQTLEKEQQLNKFRSQIISTITHEFRTPLATIQNCVEILTMFPNVVTAADRQKYLTSAENNFEQLERLIQDIAFVHDEGIGEIEYKLSLVDLIRVCKLEITSLNLATGYSHQIHLNIGPQHAAVYADEQLIRQCIKNLLENAVNYSPPQSVVEVEIQRQNDYLLIKVQDYGNGIAEHEQSYVFEDFYRGDNAISVSGTGLGLGIVKRCVERCNGKLLFESKLGKGSIFSLILPLVT